MASPSFIVPKSDFSFARKILALIDLIVSGGFLARQPGWQSTLFVDCGMKTGNANSIYDERHSPSLYDNVYHHKQELSQLQDQFIYQNSHIQESFQPRSAMLDGQDHTGWLNLKQELQSNHIDTRNVLPTIDRLPCR